MEADSKNTALAYEIYSYAKRNDIFVNVTKMMKLTYICYGVFLVISNNGKKPIDEQPQMWPYGPVFPKIREWWLCGKRKPNEECSEQMRVIVSKVLEAFGMRTATALVSWSHEVGSPWDITRNKVGDKWGTIIEDSLIKDYFKKNIVVQNG